MDTRDKNILLKIRFYVEEIIAIAENQTYESFCGNREKQYAVMMLIVNIWELAKHFSKGFVAENSQISWKQITKLGNIAAHNYEIIRMDDIWKDVAETIPVFLARIKGITERGARQVQNGQG